jgi:hypothetical protein
MNIQVQAGVINTLNIKFYFSILYKLVYSNFIDLTVLTNIGMDSIQEISRHW